MSVFDCDYVRPDSVEQALELLRQDGAAVLAGGTDLLVRMRAGHETPRLLVDVGGLGLDGIRRAGGTLRIGAAIRLAELGRSPLLEAEPLALLRACASRVGAVQTRNLATLGGNLSTGVPSADAAVGLLALDARLKILGGQGARTIPVEQYIEGPRRLRLEPGELLAAIEIPIPEAPNGARWGSGFVRMARRKGHGIATLSAAVCLELGAGGEIATLRAAMGTVAPVPLRLRRTELVLCGERFGDEVFTRAERVLQEEIQPRDSLRGTAAYRRAVAPVILRRAIEQAVETARGGGGA